MDVRGKDEDRAQEYRDVRSGHAICGKTGNGRLAVGPRREDGSSSKRPGRWYGSSGRLVKGWLLQRGPVAGMGQAAGCNDGRLLQAVHYRGQCLPVAMGRLQTGYGMADAKSLISR